MQKEESEDFIIISDDDEPINKKAKNEEIFKERGSVKLLRLFINFTFSFFTRISHTVPEKNMPKTSFVEP